MMLSRTSARQQRMRQQILNEERMSQTPHLVRIPGQRKSSGSKLIISSPTPSTQPPGSISQPTSQSPPISTPNARISSQAPSRGPGASALLAFLSGPNQRSTATTATTTVTTTNNTSPGDTESRSNHEPSVQRTGCVLPTLIQAPSSLVDSSQTPKYIAAADAGKSVSCQYQTAPRPPGLSVQVSSSLGKSTSVSEGPIAPAITERDNMEMDANLSSVSSDLNSPMESCFANILEEHGNDSIDLNSITPSIQFSTPVGSEFLNYARQHTSTNDRVHQVHCTTGQPQLGIRILQDYDTRQISPKLSEGSSPIKSSASCPTDVQGVLNPLGTSPLPVGSLGTQVGTSGSGGSLGGVSATDGGSGSGTALLFTTVSPMSRHPEEQRAAWVRDRTKKDSHNRIERKRRDYINCQISELGNLLPEEMFRDGDCKKNKGSILKNSVEFICLLRAELSQLSEVRRETNLAAKVIGQLIKRIQYLEEVCGISQGSNTLDLGNLDYHRCLQEWLLLHERNTQGRSSLSPSTKSSHYHLTDGPSRSSPGISPLGTEEFLSTDSKSIFSSPGLITGSAPAPSAPLTNCSRLNSPVASGVLIGGSRGSNLADSSSRMMRTRCTSLSVAGTGLAAEFISPAVRLPGIDFSSGQQQQLRHQRLLPSHPLSSQGRAVHVTQHAALPEQPTQPGRGSSVITTQTGQWQPHQTSHPQSQFPLQNNPFSKYRHVHTRPTGFSMDQNMDVSGLSASLPVNVNPLLCGLQNHDEIKANDIGLAHVYSFEREEFIPQMKTEPPSDPDSQTGELNFTDSGPPTLDISTSQFEALVASVSPPSSSSRLATATLNMQNPLHQNVDSPTNASFDTDDFRFDDVPME
ncbi:Transcription factor [Clonorchis sinensis]|uniref:Transcription factor n=1 Tax=Clonorchis sinensis TaxID=79923 RepID=A0A3R7CHW0_CLOSI|nr:Transcription factor [Clonorchis sinensis]